MKHYGTIDKLMAASERDLKEVEGVGSTTAVFNRKLVQGCRKYGINEQIPMAELNFGTEIDPKRLNQMENSLV